jgi:hypothetical protein
MAAPNKLFSTATELSACEPRWRRKKAPAEIRTSTDVRAQPKIFILTIRLHSTSFVRTHVLLNSNSMFRTPNLVGANEWSQDAPLKRLISKIRSKVVETDYQIPRPVAKYPHSRTIEVR